MTYRNLFAGSYGRLAVVCAGTVLLAAGDVFLRWGIGDALDAGNLRASLPLAAGILLVLSPFLLYARQLLSVKMQKGIYRRLQSKVLHGSMEALGKSGMGEISACYLTDVNQIDNFVNRILSRAFPELIRWFVTVGVMFWFDLILGIAAIAVTVLPALFLHRMSRPIAKGTGEYQKALEAANQSVVTGLYNIETVKASCKEDDFLQGSEEKLAALQKKKRSVAIWEALLGAPMLVSAFGTIIILTVLGGWLVAIGRISAGQLLTVVTSTDYIVSFVMSLEGTISASRRASVSLRRLNGFLELREEREGGLGPEQVREIVFDRIFFSYPGGEKEIYGGYSARWQRGAPIIVKGGNGEGKSTLAKLLTGIYEVSAGRILINDIPVQEYCLSSLRKRIVVVPQENMLFRGSIRDNLTCGRDIAPGQVEEACRETGIHEEILRMQDGYDTVLTEDGGVLSGGQKQRLCLARALLGEGDAYLFDEPTSALDKANRDRFAELMKWLSKDKIVVVITHERDLLEV